MWTAIFFALIAACAICALAMASYAVRRAVRVAELPHQRLRSIESKLQLSERLLSEHTDALTDLTNRMKMMKVRSASAHGSKNDNSLPDPYRDPDGWRKAINSKLAMNRLNGGG